MRLGCVGILVVLAGVFAPAADPLDARSIAAGPWLMRDEGGGWRVGLLLIPPVDAEALRSVRLTTATGAVLPTRVDVSPVERSQERQSARIAAVWHLPHHAGPVRLGPLEVLLPALPGPKARIRLAVAGARNYPDREGLTRCATALGGPLDGVLLIGPGLERRIATGGWEGDLPLVIVPPPGSPTGLTGLPRLTWSAGAPWGPLGLAVLTSHEEPALALGRLDVPWRLLVDPEDRWDLALAARRHDHLPLRTTLAQTSRLACPLILAAGSAAGFLSEPLSTDAKGMLAPRPGGTRYLQAAATGDSCQALPRSVAWPLDEPALVGLAITPRTLTLAISPVEGPPVKLTWVDAREDGLPQAGPGWGLGQTLALLAEWRAERKAEAPDLRRLEALAQELAQLDRASLAEGDWEVGELSDLAKAGPASRTLARRLVADPEFLGDEPSLIGRLPIWLQRDALLRWFAEPPSDDTRWQRLAARTPDPMIVRTVLSQVEKEPGSPLLRLLVQRLAAQAEEQNPLPLDPEPVVQARLTAAVFGSAVLSPTELRPIARGLEPRVDPLAKPPIVRFLETQGRFRAVPTAHGH